jgi:protease-4
MNLKSLPKVEGVLGLESPLAATDNGSFLNEEQLTQIENRLEKLETENSNLQTTVANATTEKNTAVEAVTNQLTEAANSLTSVETAVNASLTNLGLAVEGTLAEKLSALNAKTEVLGKNDGSSHSSPRVDGNAQQMNGFVDANASHNQIANLINK